ncbi:hypothetical protein LUZ61_008278 [Rhynchospora tenuis]|uniref:Agenet domain-containing protein n=1 Tax=Rhynchospora tenuis TaxID=198213 RepID=A0AAD5ZVB4_9POAL|nr:hypothetical protein LUZ61_008278 [Rhynchospora tenuis]
MLPLCHVPRPTSTMAMVVKLHLPFPFEAGDEVELKSFLKGFRGAWFRCKIKKTRTRKGSLQCAMEYHDFPDEKVTWTSAYEAAPKDSSSCQTHRTAKELMFRPPFPSFHKESQQPLSMLTQTPLAEVTAVVNDVWRVGDLVDLWCDGCYWSGKIIKLHADESVQVELPGPPIGEGGVYKGVLRDLRPSLNWSQENGWSVPISQENGASWYTTHLVQCPPLAFMHNESDQRADPVCHTLDQQSCHMCLETENASPVNLHAASKMALEWKVASSEEASGCERNQDLLNQAGSSGRASTEQTEAELLCFGRRNYSSQKSRRVVCSEDKGEMGNAVKNSEREHNIGIVGMEEREGVRIGTEEEIEVRESIMELEEAANKIRWLKGLLRFGFSWLGPNRHPDSPSSVWNFIRDTDTHTGTNIRKA